MLARPRRILTCVTNATWAPLSRRAAGLGPDLTVHDGIPGYLLGALQDWISDSYPHDQWEWAQLRNTLKFRLLYEDLPSPAALSEDQTLDVIDALLSWWLEPSDSSVDALDEVLTAGGAGWRLTADRRGLERRIDTTATAAVNMTLHTAGDEAQDHLATAWAAAYGRNPDPDKAYDEAVLAVEAVACPLACPASARRTLGTVIRDLRNQLPRWELTIGDTTGHPASITRLVEMLALIWEGQSRHAGSPNSRHQTQAEAEAAVHLAAVLVQWLASGVLRRKP